MTSRRTAPAATREARGVEMVPASKMHAEIARATMEVATVRDQADATIELLSERFAELELALEDTGWMRQSLAGQREFSRDGLAKLIRIARLSYLKNPLIHNGVEVQTNYVWGQGVNITAKAHPVNDVIQAFIDFRQNAQELTGHAARLMRERQLQVESNLFFVLFTNMSTGFVRVGTINVDEISDIVKNPENKNEPWLYHRTWTVKDVDPDVGTVTTKTMSAYYPDWKYQPDKQNPKFGQLDIHWDAPIYHVKTGGLADMDFGVPEIYSAIDWARAVKEDLEDYASIHRALSRFAWSLSTKGGKAGVAAAKNKLSTTLVSDGSRMEGNPPPLTASTFVGAEGWEMNPVKTSGATASPDEGRRLWLMASAGMGIPETMMSGDVSTGNLATAKSLDRPTELKMRNRQTFWSDVLVDILNYVIDQAAIRVNGMLNGHIIVDPFSGERKVELNPDPSEEGGEPMDRGIVIEFPSVLERDTDGRISAIVRAATLGNSQGTLAGTMDLKTVSRLLLSALGLEDIDEMLDELFPDNEELATATIGTPPIVPPVVPGPVPPDLAEASRELKEAIRAMTAAVAS
jgi:hypothetical protein